MTHHQKWIKPSAIVAMIILVPGGLCAIWDHFEYPLWGNPPPSITAADPFADPVSKEWPVPFETGRKKLWEMRSSLRNFKFDRKNRRILNSTNLYDQEWRYLTQSELPNSKSDVIIFHTNGSISISGPPLHFSLKNKSILGYTRPAYNVLTITTNEGALSFQISVFAIGLDSPQLYLYHEETAESILLIPHKTSQTSPKNPK